MIPEELDAANEETKDTYLSYIGSGHKMKEIVFAHGFFPAIAVPPSL